jgi:type IV pilus assembly protein PilV
MQVHRSVDAGFSLVELLVAVVILAIGLLGLAELQVTAMKGNAKSGSVIAATTIAQMAVEEIMAVNSESDPLYPMLTTAAGDYTDWPLGASETLQGVGDYSIQYKSTPNFPAGSTSGITLIEVRVVPQAGTGSEGKPVDAVAMKDLRRVYND